MDVAHLDETGPSWRISCSRSARVDCLVNNAGVSVMHRGDLLDVAVDSYDRCFDVNTRGTFFWTQAIAKTMADTDAQAGVHRSIVFVTSSNAVAASAERGEYCMSKSALSMATKLFAIRMARHGVGVYEVQPGLILTEMTEPSKARYNKLIAEGMLLEPRWGSARRCGAHGPHDGRRALALHRGAGRRSCMFDGGLLMTRF